MPMHSKETPLKHFTLSAVKAPVQNALLLSNVFNMHHLRATLSVPNALSHALPLCALKATFCTMLHTTCF